MKKREEDFLSGGIPDYDYLFTGSDNKRAGKGKGFFYRLVKMNIWQLILSTVV